MNGKSFLRNLSRKTKITIATVIVLASGSMGTAATISNHQEQVKTAKSALYNKSMIYQILKVVNFYR